MADTSTLLVLMGAGIGGIITYTVNVIRTGWDSPPKDVQMNKYVEDTAQMLVSEAFEWEDPVLKRGLGTNADHHYIIQHKKKSVFLKRSLQGYVLTIGGVHEHVCSSSESIRLNAALELRARLILAESK